MKTNKTKNHKRDALFLLQYFYPEYISSATLPYDIAKKLAEEGYSIDVLCGYPYEYTDENKSPLKEKINNINIHRVRYIRLARNKTIGRIINFLSLTFSIFLRFFKMRKFKTIFVFSNPPVLPLVAAWAAKVFKCKLVFVAYDLYPEVAIKTNSLSEKGIITKFMNYINKVVYKHASAVVALSSEMKQYITDNRNIAENKIHIIPNWYKDEFCDTNETVGNIFDDVVKERFVVGYFGNMGIAQDMEPIKKAIEFYKNHTDICFLLSGHGSKHEEIKQMIKNENINNAYIYGFLKGSDYNDALKISDCAIISLKKGLSGLCVPSKTYGYMMQQLPILAIMDHSDIVNDTLKGSGYHIVDNSPEKLIEAINLLKNNPDDCRMRAETSRNIYLNKYTSDICLNKYSELFKGLIN